VVEGRAGEVMENYPIIVDKLFVPKKTIVGVRTPKKIKLKVVVLPQLRVK
jgi:hypothetical protein